MPEDLTSLIRSLSPAALRLFKQQIASLPEAERQRTFSRLAGIPELADIIGRPTPIVQPAQEQKMGLGETMRSQEVPLWQKALAGFGAPFQWLQQNVMEPFGAIATSPFTPTVAGTEGKNWLQRELAEYRGWEEPTFTMPWGGQFRPTKGLVETLPWFLLPGIGTVAGKGGMVAGRGIAGVLGKLGTAGRVAGTALEYSPWGLAEKAAGKAITTAAKPITTRLAGKAVKAVEEAIPMPEGIQKNILAMAGEGRPGLSTETVGLVYRNSEGKPIAVATLSAEPSGAIRLGSVVADEKSLLKGKAAKAFADELKKTPNLVLPPESEMSPMGKKILEKFQKRLVPETTETVGKVEKPLGEPIYSKEGLITGFKPPKPPKPPIATEAVPSGFNEKQSGAINKLISLVKETKPVTKETLALRKPEQAYRIGEYESLLQKYRAQGLPTEEADRLAVQALSGKYPAAEISETLNVIRKGMTGDEVKTLFDVVAEAQYKSGFTRRNTIQALQDLLLTNRLQQNQIRLLEETFGPDLAKELLKKQPWKERAWREFVDIANAPRALLASCDISGLLRQGAVLSARHPIEGMKTVQPMLQAALSDKNSALMDSIIRSRAGMEELMSPTLRVTLDLTSLPYREAASLTKFEEAFASKIMNKLPFVRASNRAYVTVLNDLRSRSALNVLSSWKKAGIKYTADDLADLNQLVNWASGRGTLPDALQKQGRLLNALFFAPKLQFSRIQLPTTVLPMVTKSALVRREAWRTLLSFVGAGAGILTAAKLSGSADIELDPRSADFGKMKIGETRLDIWSGYTQYLRFLAQLATSQRKTEGGRIVSVSRGELAGRFARTKLSPATGLITDIMSGETFLGEELPPKTTKGVLGQIYERMMPLAIQDMIDAVRQEGPAGGLVASTGLLGIGVVTYTDELKRERDKVAKKTYGITWDEVGRKYGMATQLKLEQTSPSIIEAEQEQEKRFASGTPTIMGQYLNEGRSIEDTYREAIELASKEFRATNDGVTFRDKVDQASATRRQMYAARSKRKEYQDIASYYTQPLTLEQTAKMNPGDVLRREYYQKMFSADMYDQYGNYLFDEAERREQDFLTKNGQQALDYIEEYQGARWSDKPTELKMLEQAKDTLRPYWQVADYVWDMYSPELKTLADQIDILERTDPDQAKRILRRYPQILRARELIARYRKMMRTTNPIINQAYRMFYSY